jgi:hypothetical protein
MEVDLHDIIYGQWLVRKMVSKEPGQCPVTYNIITNNNAN